MGVEEGYGWEVQWGGAGGPPLPDLDDALAWLLQDGAWEGGLDSCRGPDRQCPNALEGRLRGEIPPAAPYKMRGGLDIFLALQEGAGP